MSGLSLTALLSIVLGYLAFLFLVASVAEALAPRLGSPRLRTLTYVLAASVYCTAWTFYGSVGLAANRGLEFLTIYLGPVCVALLWPLLLRKLVRVSKEQRITSVSDFISSRYGKSAALGTLVAALVVCGMIPYIALQLTAVSASFKMILREESVLEVFDPTLVVAVTLALFGILFGARNLDFTKRQTGLMTAVAAEKPPRNTSTEMSWLSKKSGSRRMNPSAWARASGNTTRPAKAMGSTNTLIRSR